MEYIKAILVDFDGTLVSSEHANSFAYSEVLANFGFFVTSSELDLVAKGKHWSQFLPYVLTDNYTIELGLKISQEKKRIYQNYFHLIGLNNALVALLKTFRLKMPVVLVTNASRDSVENLLAHFNIEDIFSFLICQDDFIKPKPDPEPYIKALDVLNLPAYSCIAFEDSNLGIQSAKAAGLHVIEVASFV